MPGMVRPSYPPGPPGYRPQMPPHPMTYRPGGPPVQPTMKPTAGVKRPPPQGILSESQKIKPVKQKKPGDRLLPPSVRDLVPESQAYSDLLHLERKVRCLIYTVYTIFNRNVESRLIIQ